MSQKKIICPHCQNDDETMIEFVSHGPKNPAYGPGWDIYFCSSCSKMFEVVPDE